MVLEYLQVLGDQMIAMQERITYLRPQLEILGAKYEGRSYLSDRNEVKLRRLLYDFDKEASSEKIDDILE